LLFIVYTCVIVDWCITHFYTLYNLTIAILNTVHYTNIAST